jgi:hypothetical protein
LASHLARLQSLTGGTSASDLADAA